MGIRRNQQGFTIIEVTLFLALTGLLAVLLLGGWTVTLNTQRYKDSVKTLQSFVQQQYNLVYNVENGRGVELVCDSSAQVEENTGTNPSRGQSDCVMMGRYIHINNGRELEVFAIVGREPTDPDRDLNDFEAIDDYQASLTKTTLGLTENELTIPWQAVVVGGDGATDPLSYAIAIVRAPHSGIVHTFVTGVANDTEALPAVTDLASAANESRDTNLCLDAGNPLAGGRMGVVINAGAASQSFIQPIPDGEGVC
jgi:type II secretory pathway pseudopilin PulG